MRKTVVVAGLLGLMICYGVSHYFAWASRAQVRRESRPGYVLPPGVSRILAVGNKGLLADYLFLKAITFFGERIQTEKKLTDADWSYLIHSLDVVTALDPYFLDPYVFIEGVLVWDAGKIEEANRLLQKGIENRSWEWRLPFYAGFNLFYFRQDYARGAELVMKASEIADSPPFLKTLGARLAYYGGKSKTAVLFLKGIMAETSDKRIRASLSRRLSALEAASKIEGALQLYSKEMGQPPESLNSLVTAGYLKQLPSDPYGGDWIVLENGRIFSTSRFVDAPKSESARPGK